MILIQDKGKKYTLRQIFKSFTCLNGYFYILTCAQDAVLSIISACSQLLIAVSVADAWSYFHLVLQTELL